MPQGTRTGQNFFTKASNFFAWLPPIPGINLFSSGAVALFGGIGTLWDTAGWLLRGKFLSALTAFGSGTAATMTNSALTASGLGWAGNAVSALTTGRNLGDNVRWGAEGLIGGVTGAIGMKPTVLRSYVAGVGSTGASTGPGYWASRASMERGQDPNAAYASYVNGDGGVHVNELNSAYGRGA